MLAGRVDGLRALLAHLHALHAPTAGPLTPYASFLRLQVRCKCVLAH